MSFCREALDRFDQLSECCLAALKGGEELTLGLSSENQHYLRFNRGKIRQSTEIRQSRLSLAFQSEGRQVSLRFDAHASLKEDLDTALSLLARAREEISALPEDPFLIPLENHGASEEHFPASLPDWPTLTTAICDQVKAFDLAGLLAIGPQLRATRNSSGARQAFSSESFCFDYSLYTVNDEGENKAVKGLLASREWNPVALHEALSERRDQLSVLARPSRPLPPGNYRVHFAPAAVQSLLQMFSWGAVSYGAWKRGDSALGSLVEGRRSLSPLFSLTENFGLGVVPRFNERGEIAPEQLPIIRAGQLENWLTSSRSALEFGVPANGASLSESLRSPEMATGELPEQAILSELDSGLLVGNLHYLNWSDLQQARVTGMTRYACFWVENGQIVAPIRDLRFDESLYRIFGSELEAVGQSAQLLTSTDTYGERALGGSRVPGILVRDFRFTL